MSEAEREPFRDEAERLRLLHIAEFPHYKYKPRYILLISFFLTTRTKCTKILSFHHISLHRGIVTGK